MLVDAGAEEAAEDSKGNTAAYYLDHPEELDLTSTAYSAHDSLLTGSTDNSFRRQHRASIFLKNGRLAFPSLSVDSPASEWSNIKVCLHMNKHASIRASLKFSLIFFV